MPNLRYVPGRGPQLRVHQDDPLEQWVGGEVAKPESAGGSTRAVDQGARPNGLGFAPSRRS